MTKSVLLIGACIALMTLALPDDARAGQGSLALLFVDVTPKDAIDKSAKRCSRYLRKFLHDEEYGEVELTRTSRRKLHKWAGKPARQPLQWSAEALEKPKQIEGVFIQAIVLVDCRPSEGHFEALISPPSGNLARIQMRSLSVDKKVAKWLSEAILRRAWAGWTL